MIGRRELLFLGACAGAAGVSYGLKPRHRLSLVKSGDKFFMATKEIKVTLGGCGG